MRSTLKKLSVRVFWLSVGASLLFWVAPTGFAQSSPAETPVKTPVKTKTANSNHSSSAKAATSSKTKTAFSTSSNAAHSKAAASRRNKARQATLRRGKRKPRGQQKIDSDRAEEIQLALIREHYLNGSATGTWNQESEAAMRRYQADHGWQSKTVPDSRALISLGLGPSHDHLLNPESAMTSDPASSMKTSPAAASIPPTATPLPAAKGPSSAPVAQPSSSDPSRPQ